MGSRFEILSIFKRKMVLLHFDSFTKEALQRLSKTKIFEHKSLMLS